MAGLIRTKITSNERLDLPDYKNIETFCIEDFNAMLGWMFSGSTCILSGFRIFQDLACLNDNPTASPIYIKLEDSTVIHSESSGTPYLYVGAQNLSAAQVTLVSGAINYIEAEFIITPSSPDTRAFWDPSANNGQGAEFTQIVDTAENLTVNISANQTGFTGGIKFPIAEIVVTGGGTITSIIDRRNLFFRLGRGNPVDPNFQYLWSQGRNEPNPNRSVDTEAFTGGDKSIATFKEWMDAIMTELMLIKGSAFWFSNGSSLISNVNLSDLFFDSIGSAITGVGRLTHSDSTPGMLTWTSDIFIKSVIGPLTFTIPANNITLADKQVAYITLVRNIEIPSFTFQFTNGTTQVSANVGGFSSFIVGDYIKAKSHNMAAWNKILSFDTGIPATATSCTLETVYEGASTTEAALRSQGSYSVSVSDPIDVPADSNVFWIAKRDDNSVSNKTIDTIPNNGLVRSNHIVTVKTTIAHGFKAGQSISITGASNSTFNKKYEIIDPAPGGNSLLFTVYDSDSDASSGNGIVSPIAKIYVKTIGELEAGEEQQISDSLSAANMRFVGAESETDTTPNYPNIPNILCPYQFTDQDSLTVAIGQNAGNMNTVMNTLDLPSYDEDLVVVSGATSDDNEVTGPVSDDSILTMPLHSRSTPPDQVQYYIVGKGALEVYLNGQMLKIDTLDGWSEVGVAGSYSNQITIRQELSVGDVIKFRIDATGGPGQIINTGGGSAPDDDFITLPASTMPDNADYCLIWDASVPGYRKQLKSDFLTGVSVISALRVRTYFNVDHNANIATEDVILMNCSTGSRTVYLPDPALNDGTKFDIKKIDATSNSMIINGNGNNIDNMLTVSTIVPYTSFSVVSDGVQWWVI